MKKTLLVSVLVVLMLACDLLSEAPQDTRGGFGESPCWYDAELCPLGPTTLMESELYCLNEEFKGEDLHACREELRNQFTILIERHCEGDAACVQRAIRKMQAEEAFLTQGQIIRVGK